MVGTRPPTGWSQRSLAASPTMRRQMCSATALWFVRSSQGWTLTQMDEGKYNLIIVAAVVVVMGNGGMTKQCFFGSAFYK